MYRLNLFHFLQLRRKYVCVSCMNQRHRSGKDKSREERRQGGQKTASTQASRDHLISLSCLLVAGTKDLVGLFIQPNVEDLTGGQYVGKDK